MLRSIGYSSHARHVSVWFGFPASYDEYTALGARLVTCCSFCTRELVQLRKRRDTFEQWCDQFIVQFSLPFSVISVLRSAPCMKFAFSRSRCAGCSSETLTHCVHIPQALSLDQENVTLCLTVRVKFRTQCLFTVFQLGSVDF